MNTLLIGSVIFLGIAVIVLLVVLYRHLHRRRPSKFTPANSKLSLAGLLNHHRTIAWELDQHVDQFTALRWQINKPDRLRKGLRDSVQGLVGTLSMLYPFRMSSIGLIEAISERISILEAQYVLRVDLASSSPIRYDLLQEWSVFHLVNALLTYSAQSADSRLPGSEPNDNDQNAVSVILHLGFFEDHLLVRYNDETSPLPSAKESSVQFWLDILGVQPAQNSRNEWGFRFPMRTTIPEQRNFLFG